MRFQELMNKRDLKNFHGSLYETHVFLISKNIFYNKKKDESTKQISKHPLQAFFKCCNSAFTSFYFSQFLVLVLKFGSYSLLCSVCSLLLLLLLLFSFFKLKLLLLLYETIVWYKLRKEAASKMNKKKITFTF